MFAVYGTDIARLKDGLRLTMNCLMQVCHSRVTELYNFKKFSYKLKLQQLSLSFQA